MYKGSVFAKISSMVTASCLDKGVHRMLSLEVTALGLGGVCCQFGSLEGSQSLSGSVPGAFNSLPPQTRSNGDDLLVRIAETP